MAGRLSCAGVRRPVGLLAIVQGRGRREEGQGDGTCAREAKIAEAYVKRS
jgi:hypothetical protein